MQSVGRVGEPSEALRRPQSSQAEHLWPRQAEGEAPREAGWRRRGRWQTPWPPHGSVTTGRAAPDTSAELTPRQSRTGTGTSVRGAPGVFHGHHVV